MAIENIAKQTDHIRRCFLLGFSAPLSVNMLKTNTAESTEVTKKLTNKISVITLRNPANG